MGFSLFGGSVARTRLLHPNFFDDAKLCKLELGASLLYAGLWCHADRNGVIEHDPDFAKSKIFSRRPEITRCQLVKWTDQLVRVGMLRRARVQGVTYLKVTHWERYQTPHTREKVLYHLDLSIFEGSKKPGPSPGRARGEPNVSISNSISNSNSLSHGKENQAKGEERVLKTEDNLGNYVKCDECQKYHAGIPHAEFMGFSEEIRNEILLSDIKLAPLAGGKGQLVRQKTRAAFLELISCQRASMSLIRDSSVKEFSIDLKNSLTKLNFSKEKFAKLPINIGQNTSDQDEVKAEKTRAENFREECKAIREIDRYLNTILDHAHVMQELKNWRKVRENRKNKEVAECIGWLEKNGQPGDGKKVIHVMAFLKNNFERVFAEVSKLRRRAEIDQKQFDQIVLAAEMTNLEIEAESEKLSILKSDFFNEFDESKVEELVSDFVKETPGAKFLSKQRQIDLTILHWSENKRGLSA